MGFAALPALLSPVRWSKLLVCNKIQVRVNNRRREQEPIEPIEQAAVPRQYAA